MKRHPCSFHAAASGIVDQSFCVDVQCGTTRMSQWTQQRGRINFSVEFPAGIDAVIHSAPPLRKDCLLLVAMVTGFLKETLHVTHFVLLER